MAFFDDLFGRLTPRPPIDVFGGQGLDAFGELMGDGSDALQPITPFGPSGGFLGGLGGLTSSTPSFWQMPQLGGDLGGFGESALPIRTGIQPRGARSLTTTPTDTFTPRRPGLFSKKPAATTTTPSATPTGQQAQTAASGGTADATYTAAGVPNVSDNVTRWYPLAKKYADQFDVPVEAILAVIHNESGGNPGAASAVNSENRGRAVGLMQMLPIYHAKDGADLTNPEINISRGVRYFAQAYHNRGNDLNKAMAEYFGGGGAFDSAGNIRTDIGDMNITIGKYLPKFQAATAAYRQWLARQGQPPPAPTTAPPPQAANGPADLADLWGWLGGSRSPVTGRFGAQDGPYPGTGHRGMDIGTPSGTRLTSPVEGVVMAAGDVGGGYGNQVRIKTAYGSVLLGHLSSVNVQPGQRVTPGTMLGLTGSTGRSTGPHLHVELRDPNDNAIDPARYYRW
jgi:murein DD-endopeptidase MepM/ murein hydrolase activator NlpD